MRNFLVICSILLVCSGCMRYFSAPQSQRGYHSKHLKAVLADTLHFFYSVQYDSVADKNYRDTILYRGQDFEHVSAFLVGEADSLFNFGFPVVTVKEVEAGFLKEYIHRKGRKNIIRNTHLTSRPLFGQFYSKIDSAWTSINLQKDAVLLIEFKFGKAEYTVSYGNPTLVSYILADVNVIDKNVVLYSRVWITRAFLNIKDEQLDGRKREKIRWFTEENLIRLAAAIRKDLSQKLLR